MRITLLGAGAWGTALAIAFAGKNEVTLWSREEDVAVDLRNTRENHRFLPGHKLPEGVRIETDFAVAIAGADLLVIATPIAGLRPTVERLKALNCALPVTWSTSWVRLPLPLLWWGRPLQHLAGRSGGAGLLLVPSLRGPGGRHSVPP